jgi:hypothetical protein
MVMELVLAWSWLAVCMSTNGIEVSPLEADPMEILCMIVVVKLL